MWDRYLNRGTVSVALSTLALFAACNAQETDFADDVPGSGGSGASDGGTSGAAGASSTGGRAGSSSTGGTSASGGSDSGGSAGSPNSGGDAGSGSGGDAVGESGGAGGLGGDGGSSGGIGGEGGGAAGGSDGEGGRDGRGGDDGAGSGGEGGSGGSDFVCQTGLGTPAQPVVSDLESEQLGAIAPYAGAWEPFFDGGAATLSIVADGADLTEHALRLSGSNSTFAGLAIGLNDDGTHACPHDASAFAGIRFFYKSTHPLTAQLTSRATVPPPDGTCSGTCSNYHQKTFPPAAHWTEVVLRYSDLEQTIGVVAPIARDELLSIRFRLSGVVSVGSASGSIVGSFEAEVDELEFFAD
jgi:hypothetical protein